MATRPHRRSSADREPLATARRYFREFCQSTSLHGLRYLGEERRPLPERACWLVAFCVSVAACACVIVKLWTKWEASPVIVSFSETSTPISRIPFPAVTVCSETKIRQRWFNTTRVYTEGPSTADEALRYQYASLLCDVAGDRRGEDTILEAAMDFIETVSPQMDDVFHECYWRGANASCSELFSPVLTDEGLCFAFNTIRAGDLFTDSTLQRRGRHLHHARSMAGWTLEDGYAAATDDAYPRRAVASGAKAGLRLLLHNDAADFDPFCKLPVQGFKVQIHNPVDFPLVGHQFFRVAADQDVVVRVRPNMMTTNHELFGYSAVKRQCFLSDERRLRYFRIYTQDNCELECLTNYTLRQCGCASYYMPRSPDTSVCGPGSVDCALYAIELLHEDAGVQRECGCLPACTEISYDVETSQARLEWRALLPYLQDRGDHASAQISHVSIYFKDMQIITSRRSELYGDMEFLASCGGLLGLFLGFSILSLVEVLYFLTLRLVCNLRANKRP